MKNLIYFSSLCLLLLATSCKKKCANGYSGAQCQVYDSCFNINCSTHGHCVSGNCVCDSGWAGIDCNETICEHNHTGSILITNNTGYDINAGNSMYQFSIYVSSNQSIIQNDVPADSLAFLFTSTQTCVPLIHPCYLKTGLIVVNECQQTTYVIQ